MDNQEWFRDIENIISEYFNQHMNNNRNTSPSPPPPQSSNTNPFFRNEDLSEYRLYLLINEFLQDYYANIRLYQENIRDMIQLLREFRNDSRQVRPERNIPHPFRQSNQPPQPPHAQIPRQQPTNPAIETATFAYFIQPFNTDTQPHVGLSQTQIENAIETIIYDESMSNRYSESDVDESSYERCPICLEDFQIGEEVCRIRVCGHIFKRPGLMYWFGRNNHCPVCRRDVNMQIEQMGEETQLDETPAVNNLIQNHIRAPLIREFNNFIQNMAENNRNGRTLFSFLDVSGNIV
jgi:hypothetical protein